MWPRYATEHCNEPSKQSFTAARRWKSQPQISHLGPGADLVGPLVHRCHRCCFFYGVGVVPPKENDGKILAANFLKLKFIKIQWQRTSMIINANMKNMPCMAPKYSGMSGTYRTDIPAPVKGVVRMGSTQRPGGLRDLCLKRNVHQQIPPKSLEIPDLLSPNNGSIWVLSSFDCSHF